MNRVGPGRARREHVARVLPARRADAISPACATRATSARARRATATRRGASRRSSSWPGTASGIGAGTTTMARRSDRRRTTNAGSIRSRSRGPCSRARCRRGSPSARWTRCARRSSRADRSSSCCSIRRSIARRRIPGYIKAYPPGVRENGGQYTHAAVWVVMALARLGCGDEVGGAVSHAQSDQPHAHGGATSSGTRPSRTSWPATSTPARRTPAAAAGAGTRDRRRGCIGPASKACWACGGAATRSASIPAFRRRGRATRSCGAWAAHALRHLGLQPRTAVPWRGEGVARRRRRMPPRFRSSMMAGRTVCAWCSAAPRCQPFLDSQHPAAVASRLP